MATARFRPHRRPKPSAADADTPFAGSEDRSRESASDNGVKQPAAGPFIHSRENGGAAITADETAPGPHRRAQRVRARRRQGPSSREIWSASRACRGACLGDRYVRVCRVQSDDFERAAPGHLIATEEALEARGPAGRAFGKIKRTVIGAPLSTAQAAHERLTKTKALAVLSSDALSSVAYATEEILHVLLLAGLGALALSLPIGAGIVALLLIVGISYRQTIKAYPAGGGSYIVAKDNLGELPALTAGAALLFGYVVTVAVSIAAGVAALTSAVPQLRDHPVVARSGIHPPGDRAQPARDSGIGQHLRRADLPVPGRHHRHDRARSRPRGITWFRGAGPGDDRRRDRNRDPDGRHPAHPDGLQPGLRGADRRRGDLGRRARVSTAGVEERARDPDLR